MVTKEHLDQLRAERATPEMQLDYTPGGTLETEVKIEHEAERERDIKLAERAFNDAQRHMELEYMRSSLEGLPTSHFNEPKQEI